MKLVATTVSETSLRMRYADNADAQLSTEWIEFRLKISDLRRPSDTPIANPELLPLAELHRAALQHARDVLDSEIQRLRELEGRRREDG